MIVLKLKIIMYIMVFCIFSFEQMEGSDNLVDPKLLSVLSDEEKKETILLMDRAFSCLETSQAILNVLLSHIDINKEPTKTLYLIKIKELNDLQKEFNEQETMNHISDLIKEIKTSIQNNARKKTIIDQLHILKSSFDNCSSYIKYCREIYFDEIVIWNNISGDYISAIRYFLSKNHSIYEIVYREAEVMEKLAEKEFLARLKRIADDRVHTLFIIEKRTELLTELKKIKLPHSKTAEIIFPIAEDKKPILIEKQSLKEKDKVINSKKKVYLNKT